MSISLLDTAQHVISYHTIDFRFYKGLIYSGDIFHINILGQSVIFKFSCVTCTLYGLAYLGLVRAFSENERLNCIMWIPFMYM